MALDAATQASIIEQAKQRAAASGKTPEQELWDYAKSIGMDANGIDAAMGWGQGTSQGWYDRTYPQQQPNLGLNSQPAAQPTASKPAPLDAATRASIIQQAKDRAAKSGKSPEQELFDYAKSQGIDSAGIDTYMGFPAGTTQNWAANNQKPAPQGNVTFNPTATQAAQPSTPNQTASGPGVDKYSDQVKALYSSMQSMNAAGNTAGAKDAYNNAQKTWGFTDAQFAPYATNGNGTFTADQIAAWKAPEASTQTSTQNTQQTTQPQYSQNLGLSGAPDPVQLTQYKKNPYLDETAKNITQQMDDNWTRNLAPSIRSGAMAAGGFGGSRQGVVEANGLNDMNRSLSQNLTNLYGTDYNNQMGRNLQQYQGDQQTALSNKQANNNYDLGLRSSDLGFGQLDANINQQNFNNQLSSAQFGLNAYNTLNNNNATAVNAGTQIQNTPLEYQKYFTNSANGIGNGYGTQSSTSTQPTQSNGLMNALGGAQLASGVYNAYNKANTIPTIPSPYPVY